LTQNWPCVYWYHSHSSNSIQWPPCYSDSWVVIVIKFCLLHWSVEAKKEGTGQTAAAAAAKPAKDAAPADKETDKTKAKKKNVGRVHRTYVAYTVTQ